MSELRQIAVVRSEAKRAARYFTGKPCKYGHIAERWVSTKICVECSRLYKHSEKERARARLRSRIKNAKNPEKNRERVRLWRKANPDKRRAAARRHCERRKEHRRAYRVANKERLRAYYRARYLREKERISIVNRNNKAKRKGAGGKYTADDIRVIFSAQRKRCAYCRVNLKPKGYHIDHIIPIILGGSNNPSNLQITCSTCNLRKSKKHPVEYAQSLGLLI